MPRRASDGGKPAGVPCPQLAADLRCRLFGRPERPAVCASLAPSREMCGADRDAALAYLTELERLTAPEPGPLRGPREVPSQRQGS